MTTTTRTVVGRRGWTLAPSWVVAVLVSSGWAGAAGPGEGTLSRGSLPPEADPIASGHRPVSVQVPHIPDAVSRPAGWPTAKTSFLDNHVLSSIREQPGAPLDPVDEEGRPLAEASSDNPAGPSGIILADYQEPLPEQPQDEGLIPGTTIPGAAIPGARSLESALVVARVGSEVVLAGDLMTPSASEWLAKVSPGLQPEQIRELKLQIYKQVLTPHLETLLIYVDACRVIPEEKLPEIQQKVNEAFDTQQLPKMMAAAGVATAVEYEQSLRSQGQSLDRIRKMFFERALAQEWMQQHAGDTGEIPHAEMIAWYQNHLSDYEFPARTRFEQLTLKHGTGRTREQAWDLMAAMGNEVLQGRAFGDVAREKSEGPTAAQGGSYDWTTRGSLVSTVLDEAVFTLPIGQLSAILEDANAVHIVRVTERVDAGRRPFLEAQVEIREELQAARRKKAIDDYLDRLRARTPVWTVFDDGADGPGSMAGRTRPIR
jgi:parvulin-like peptidyl-prolyl isomerase